MKPRTATLLVLATALLILAAVIYSPTLTGKATSGFSVGLTLDPATIQWDSYEQNSTAISGGSQVTLTAPITYYNTGVQPVNDPISTDFTAGNNFTVYENYTELSTTRTGNTLYWTANLDAPAYVQWLVPAPTITTTFEDTSAYRIDFTLDTTTPLKNTTYSFNVPTGITGAVLYENQTIFLIDRTNTYDLTISGDTATITNIFFTNNTMSRTLYLTATLPTNPGGGGGGGGGGGSGPAVVYTLPSSISSTPGDEQTETGTIINNQITSLDLVLTYTPSFPGFSVSPTDISIPPRESMEISFVYEPPITAIPSTQKTTLHFKGDDNEIHELDLIVEKPQHTIVIDEPAEGTSSFSISIYDEYVEITGEVVSTGEITATLDTFIRDDTGAPMKVNTRTFTSSQSYSFSESLFIADLEPGTYEACVSLKDDFATSMEDCRSLTITTLREEFPGVVEKVTDYFLIALWVMIIFMLIMNFLVFFGDHFPIVRNTLLSIYYFTHRKK